MKYIKFVFLTLLVLIIVLGVNFSPREHTQTEFMMDTFISVTAYGANSKEAVAAAVDRIAEIDKKFNAHSRDSEVYRINSQQKTENVDAEVYELIKAALEFSETTDGAFDVTLKPVSDLWQIGTENERVPQKEEIEKALNLTGREFVVLSDEDRSVEFLKKGMAIDLGGVAKGYAVGEATEVLRGKGIENAYLDLGGNISVIGKKPLGFFDSLKYGGKYRDFIIGVQDPKGSRGEIIDTVAGSDNYIVTSGAYERNFTENGIIYHHILDGRTGYPAEIKLDSVTVVSDNAAEADMISTAIFVLGKEGIDKIPDGLYDEIIFANNGKTEHIKSIKNQRD